MVSRTKLELIMESFGDCKTLEHGGDALAVFQQAHQDGDPFNLIMLDIKLPGIDGIQLLSAIRKAEKQLGIEKSQQAKILMTTSYRDKERIVASVQHGCDDYIGKPVTLELIRNKLEKLGIRQQTLSSDSIGSDTPVMQTTDQIYSEIVHLLEQNQVKLPSLPRLFIKFRELTAQQPSLDDIIDLLKNDIAITAEIIRRSNSAYNRGYVTNKSLDKAVARLGYDATVRVVSEMSIRKFFTMQSQKYRPLVDNLWKHSISCAYAAELMSEFSGLELEGDPFLMGLLHDIGKLALLQIIADMERQGKFNGDIHSILLVNMLDEYHCQLGAKLLDRWKFADYYIHAALHHRNPKLPADIETSVESSQSAYDNESMLVHIASQTANLMGYDILASGPVEIDLNDVAPVERFNLQPDKITTTKEYVTQRMTEVQNLF